jgi:hypothetical protein
MLVIARVANVNKHVASKDYNPYKLAFGQTFFQCELHCVENIVGFEEDQFGFTNYECTKK